MALYQPFAYGGLVETLKDLKMNIPVNKGNNRKLDCAVISYVHQTQITDNKSPYDTVRSAFDEGEKVYEGASFTSHSHLQVCVTNPRMITGYFLPRPVDEFNPYLKKEFLDLGN